MGGGDSGGGDYQAKQAETEARKSAARAALNYQFGIGEDPGVYVAPAATGLARVAQNMSTEAPSRDSFMMSTNQQQPHSDEGWGPQGTQFDQQGYDQATADWKARSAQPEIPAVNPNRGARDALYQTVRDNTFSAGKRGLDEGRDDAARKLKFELFAKGLNSGSEDINQNALLGRTYQQGLLDLGGKADAAKANFRGNDETTRLGLLQSIDAGMDQGSALSSAIGQMQVNNDKAAAEAQGTTLGDLFANSGLIYNKSQAAQGKQAGTEWWNNYNPAGNKASKASTGMITGVQ